MVILVIVVPWQVDSGKGITVIVAPPSSRFAAGWELQRLWRTLALPRGMFASGWGFQQFWRHLGAGIQQDGDCNDCGAIYWQVCSGMGIAAIVVPSTGRFAAGLGLQ